MDNLAIAPSHLGVDGSVPKHLAYSYSKTSQSRVTGQVTSLKWQTHKLFSGSQKKKILKQRKWRRIKRLVEAKDREATDARKRSVLIQLTGSATNSDINLDSMKPKTIEG